MIYERRTLSEASHDLLLQLMFDTEGSPKRLLRGLPPGVTLAHKTGTGGTKDKITGATNDIGIITLPDGRHIAIAVFIMDSPAPAVTRADIMGKIARAAIEKWAPGLIRPKPTQIQLADRTGKPSSFGKSTQYQEIAGHAAAAVYAIVRTT